MITLKNLIVRILMMVTMCSISLIFSVKYLASSINSEFSAHEERLG